MGNMGKYSEFLTNETAASFERHFKEVAALQASPQEKTAIFMAKTKLGQHFLGLQMSEEGGQGYQEASEGIKKIIHGAITKAVAGNAELEQKMQQLDMSNYQTMLEGAFSHYQLQDIVTVLRAR